MTDSSVRIQRRTNLAVLLGGLLAIGCGRSAPAPTPSSPDAVVAGFLGAVRANDLDGMAALWGTGSRGPASRFMSAEQRNQRLSVIRAYLVHERYDVLGSNAAGGGDERAQIVRVRLTRQGCSPVVPITLVPWGGGWLVSDIDLAAAGNPRERCNPGGATPPTR